MKPRTPDSARASSSDPLLDGERFRLLGGQVLRRLKAGERVLVSGPRRSGKTTAVLQEVRGISKAAVVHCDLAYVTSAYDATDRLARSAACAFSELGWANQVPSDLAALRYGDEAELYAPFVKILAALDSAKGRVVAVFDGIDHLASLGEGMASWVLGVMRSEIQRHARASYVFIGSDRATLARLFEDPKAAFHGSVVEVPIQEPASEVLEEAVTRGFITNLFSPESGVAEAIIAVSRRVGDVEAIMRQAMRRAKGRRVGLDAVRLAVAELVEEAGAVGRHVFALATPNQRRALMALACLPCAELTKGRTLAELGIGTASIYRRGLEPFLRGCDALLEQTALGVSYSSPFVERWVVGLVQRTSFLTPRLVRLQRPLGAREKEAA